MRCSEASACVASPSSGSRRRSQQIVARWVQRAQARRARHVPDRPWQPARGRTPWLKSSPLQWWRWTWQQRRPLTGEMRRRPGDAAAGQPGGARSTVERSASRRTNAALRYHHHANAHCVRDPCNLRLPSYALPRPPPASGDLHLDPTAYSQACPALPTPVVPLRQESVVTLLFADRAS